MGVSCSFWLIGAYLQTTRLLRPMHRCRRASCSFWCILEDTTAPEADAPQQQQQQRWKEDERQGLSC